MIDLSQTIQPKSDQLNADDMIAGAMQLKITGVRVVQGDQPICIDYEGGQGRPYKPCKSMRRVLIHLWGSDGSKYIGRTIIVYNEKTVKWAGKEVGGIRISHMSHIEKDERIAITESRGRRASIVIKKIETAPVVEISEKDFLEVKEAIERAETMADLQVITNTLKQTNYSDNSRKMIGEVYTKRLEEVRVD